MKARFTDAIVLFLFSKLYSVAVRLLKLRAKRRRPVAADALV